LFKRISFVGFAVRAKRKVCPSAAVVLEFFSAGLAARHSFAHL
jgi:hypothetical protein